MKIRAIPIFKFMRILSIACFGVFGIIHLISVIKPDSLAPISAGIPLGLFSTFGVLFMSYSIVIDTNPKVREIRIRKLLAYQFSGEYYRTAYGPFWTFTPVWAKFVIAGIFSYGLFCLLVIWRGDFRIVADIAATTLRYATSSGTFFYWLSIWLWHAEIKRREPARDEFGEPVSN